MNDRVKVLNWKFNVANFSGGTSEIVHEASPDELKRLARDFNLREVQSCKVQFKIEPWQKSGFSVNGKLSAVVIQDCIVSLVPVENSIAEEFSINFVPESEGSLYEPDVNSEGVIEIDYLDSDPPDLYAGTEIDLGELTEEQFALNLPTFPRAVGVEFSEEISGVNDSDSSKQYQNSPFSVLSELKMKQNDKK